MQCARPTEDDMRRSRQSLHDSLDLLLDKYSDKPSMLVKLKWQLAEGVPSALACYEVKSEVFLSSESYYLFPFLVMLPLICFLLPYL